MPFHSVIFVEGSEDEHFFNYLLQDMEIEGIETQIIGGNASKLQNIQPRILQKSAEGKRIAVIVDADTDAAERQSELRVKIADLELPIENFFVIPNDFDAGSLETLLEAMATEPHRVVHDCFERYQDCLRDQGDIYHTPNLKAKAYAYCEALGISPKPEERNYSDRRYWNMDAPILAKLKEFLTLLNNPGS